MGIEQRGWYVPLCIDESDGSVWGYTSVPNEALNKFYSSPENSFSTWTWAKNGFQEGWYLSLGDFKDALKSSA